MNPFGFPTPTACSLSAKRNPLSAALRPFSSVRYPLSPVRCFQARKEVPCFSSVSVRCPLSAVRYPIPYSLSPVPCL